MKYWVPFDEMNLIHRGSFSQVGMLNDLIENKLENKLRALHHKMLASSLATKLAHDSDKNNQVTAMVLSNYVYPATSKFEDAIAAQLNDQFKNYYLDVLVRRKYPGTMLRFIKEQGFDSGYKSEDDDTFENGKADFISISYYGNRTVLQKVLKIDLIL